MIRLFKHYIPHAVILLWLVDLIMLVAANELSWRLRANQIGIATGSIADRVWPHFGFAAMMVTAMIAVGVYGGDALRSMRFAAARASSRLRSVRRAAISIARLAATSPSSGWPALRWVRASSV